MKAVFILLFFPLICLSQDQTEAGNKVREGVALHDEGKFQEALSKYDEALKIDKDNLLALSEKAMTLNAARKYKEAVDVCKHAIKSHPDGDVRNVYVTYANSLDQMNDSDAALKIYDQALKKYPTYYHLHFNKGITLVNSKKMDKALTSFQAATRYNPNHAGSFNALAVLSQDNRIPSILASGRYLTIDNQSARAKGNFDAVIRLMGQGVSQKEDQSITLSLDPETVDMSNSKKVRENNFSSTDLVLSMAAALDFDSKNADKTPCGKFIDKFSSVCQSMDETKSRQKGYFWEFLAPYFIEMEKKDLIEPFAYIVFLPSQDEDVIRYHKENADKIRKFYDWSNDYQWK